MLEKKNNSYFIGIKQLIIGGKKGKDYFINKLTDLDYLDMFPEFSDTGYLYFEINKELEKEIKDLEEEYKSKGIDLRFSYKNYLGKEGIVYEHLILKEEQKKKGIFKETSQRLKKIGDKYEVSVYAFCYDRWTEKNLLLKIYEKAGWISVEEQDFGIPYMTHKVK